MGAAKFWLVYWFAGTAGLFAWVIASGGSEWAGPFRSEAPGLLLGISYLVSTWSPGNSLISFYSFGSLVAILAAFLLFLVSVVLKIYGQGVRRLALVLHLL